VAGVLLTTSLMMAGEMGRILQEFCLTKKQKVINLIKDKNSRSYFFIERRGRK